MINNKVKLDKNPNLESIREFVNYFEKSYGKMSLIELEKVENDKVVSIGSYFTIDDMLAKIDNNTFSNAAFLNIYFAHSLQPIQKIELDLEKREISFVNCNLNMTLDKNKDDLNIPTQTIEQAMSDENAIYYKFENGKIAKYSKEEGLYYTLNKKNEWKVDERVLPWIIGSDYDYDVIKPHKKVGR